MAAELIAPRITWKVVAETITITMPSASACLERNIPLECLPGATGAKDDQHANEPLDLGVKRLQPTQADASVSVDMARADLRLRDHPGGMA